jgi:hypothetical protein
VVVVVVVVVHFTKSIIYSILMGLLKCTNDYDHDNL